MLVFNGLYWWVTIYLRYYYPPPTNNNDKAISINYKKNILQMPGAGLCSERLLTYKPF